MKTNISQQSGWTGTIILQRMYRFENFWQLNTGMQNRNIDCWEFIFFKKERLF